MPAARAGGDHEQPAQGAGPGLPGGGPVRDPR